MYVCMYEHTHTHIQTLTHTQDMCTLKRTTHIYTYLHTSHIYTFRPIYKYIYLWHTYICIYLYYLIYAYIFCYMYLHPHAYTSTLTHTLTHTYIFVGNFTQKLLKFSSYFCFNLHILLYCICVYSFNYCEVTSNHLLNIKLKLQIFAYVNQKVCLQKKRLYSGI